MKRLIAVIILTLALVGGLQAQPYMITATNYASGFFGVVADENGQPLASGSLLQLIWDSEGNGMNPPALNGLPTGDDVLMGACFVAMTGGAPSAGNFVLPGTAPAEGGWIFLRAFNAASPTVGTYYSESVTEFLAPLMDDPILYGVEFPDVMTASLGGTTDLTVTAAPVDPPISLPVIGGSFDYNVVIANNIQTPVTYDVWIDLVLPNGNIYGPLLTRTGLTMPTSGSLARTLSQSIPGGAPAGLYLYQVHSGVYLTGAIIAEDSFPFEKEGAAGSDGLEANLVGWEVEGWETTEFITSPIPDVFFMAPPYPNPFNPSTQFQFGLPDVANVRIDVYNILGSKVTTLIDKQLKAGYHTVIWDAPNVASGLYLVQMRAGGFVHTRKAFLMK
ncbi:T9SS type A sorting domain-containing protein [bacterium]|nr:T9SS type A sorting domain-containing protein [bacterium]